MRPGRGVMRPGRYGILGLGERGFLLVELSVALAIILPLMLIFTGTLYSLTKTQAQSSATMASADQVRYALQQMQQDLQSVALLNQASPSGFSAVVDGPDNQTYAVSWTYDQTAGTLERSVNGGPGETVASGLKGVSFSYLGRSGQTESDASCVSRVEVSVDANPDGALAPYVQDLGVNLHDVAIPGDGSC